MGKFSQKTLDAARLLTEAGRTMPYGSGKNREWLFDLLGQAPDVLGAVASIEGVSLQGSSAAGCRLAWRVLCDMRHDLLVSFLWKVRAQTTHETGAVVEGDTLAQVGVAEAVAHFMRQTRPEGKRVPPFKLRELVKLVSYSDVPTSYPSRCWP